MLFRCSVRSHGNAIVEYVLLTALTALATIAIFRVFRADLSTAYKKAGEAIIRGVDDDSGTPPSSPN